MFAVAGTGVVAASGAGRSSPGEIVFAVDRAPAVSGEIIRVSSDGRRTNLSRSPSKDSHPVVSPDGTKVAFFSLRNGRAALYVVGSDGRGLTRISSSYPVTDAASVTEWTYVWAPDSQRLAVVTYKPLKPALYVMQPGRRERLIAQAPRRDPSWSPDGRLITVGTSRPLGHNFVQAFTPAGARIWRLYQDGEFAWSAKGRLAVADAGVIRVYDERLHLLSRSSADAFAWSATGDRLASLFGDELQVRTSNGRRVLLKKFAPGEWVQWAGGRHVFVWSLRNGSLVVDITTGRTRRAKINVPGVFSRDGALLPKRIGSRFALQIVPFGGGRPRTVARVPGCWNDHGNEMYFEAAVDYLQFTADGRSLVYQSNCSNPFRNLYAIASDGTKLRRLTRAPDYESQPQVSPDGSRIAYSRSLAGSCGGCSATIWVRDADGSHPRQLTPVKQDTWDTGPSWSPDGSKIAFRRAQLSSSGVFVVPSNGRRAQKLHVYGQQRWGPTWSRDGRQASLEVDDHVVIDVAGSRRIRLPLVRADSVAWSPDGRSFVLTARANSTAPSDVYTVDVDGRNLKRLTWNLNASSASWRP
jgi:Tol biopolymer transport system component